MKLVFSRKGFDSAAGKAPSPIIGGRPVSLPIPAAREIATTYGAIGLGDTVREVTRGRLTGSDGCHHDPMFVAGECILGQQGAAQSHLARNGVGRGDLFLFFGLFADEASGERHHRFFGYMRVEAVIPVEQLNPTDRADLQRLRQAGGLCRTLAIADKGNRDPARVGDCARRAPSFPRCRDGAR